ncbi:adenylosuccinate lyase [Candidatus Peregrinibacteria bacterium]|nr:adenylosuccinate lyase [Candidatus Peregrinibacteria bacterium]
MSHIDSLLAISPLDGRYRGKLESLQNYFSEMALIRYRVMLEVEWLICLCNTVKFPNTKPFTIQDVERLREIYGNFTLSDAEKVKKFELTTNHDVKAVEYFVRDALKKNAAFRQCENFVHFALTSEDVNNMAYNLMVKDFLENEYEELLQTLIDELSKMAEQMKDAVMLARTHGQSASPTTMGKELMNFIRRLQRQTDELFMISLPAKWSGAVGNFNAHVVAYPEIDWIAVSRGFIEQFDFEPNLYTTQIEPHDTLSALFDNIRRINTILLDFDRDMWTYISLGYFHQKTKEGEVGSSTMPHKVNPIDFENSEGNLGLANALLTHFSEKLPISRLQRDLSDSTVLRNVGVAFGYSSLAIISTLRGLKKLVLNREALDLDLDNNWEILSEAIQTVLRKNGVPDAYEKLKSLTRGKKMTKEDIARFVRELPIDEKDKKRLLALTPRTYVGLSGKLAERTL